MRRLAVVPLVLGLTLAGCFSSSDTGAAANAEEASAKKKGRTYANPESKLTAEERRDILALCTAVAECDRKRCTKAEEVQAYGAVQPQSQWGKLMMKHLQEEGRAKAGHRLARLLVTEDLKWASTDCRSVVKKYGRNYQ